MKQITYTAITLLFFLGFCLIATDVAQADNITYDDAIPEESLPLDATMTFPQFNPMSGILTSVDITATSDLTGSLSYQNPIDESISVRIHVTGFQSLTLPDSTLLTADANLFDVDETLSAFEQENMGFEQSLTAQTTISENGALGDFVGDGEVHLPANVTAIWDASGSNPNILIGLLARSNAAASLQYNYAIPQVSLQKLTNGADADDPNGLDVPQIAAGEAVTWTYIVTNTGPITIPLTSINISDSHDSVTPQLVLTSDDGDGLLSPGEGWIYQAFANAADLLDPADIVGSTIVNGCGEGGGSATGRRATYENVGSVTVPGFTTTDPSHYCNPPAPAIIIEKETNGADADNANGSDVPELAPGESITWTYVITNSGNVTFTAAQITVTDDITGVTPSVDASSDDGDGLLSPGESWRYHAAGVAADLLIPAQTVGFTLVSGCDREGSAPYGGRRTYKNIGTVAALDVEDSDPSHYCNLARPAIDIEKSTNGADADLPNGEDVPRIQPGGSIRWAYVVTNSGNITFTMANVVVTDNIFNVFPVFDPTSDDGDALLSPGEHWIYTAVGQAVDLTDANQTANLMIVDGCGTASESPTDQRPTYRNTGRVATPDATDTDDSHYCNPATPTSIDLTSFTATSQEDGILIAWEVAMEVDTAGYNLYRSTSTDRSEATRVNQSMIPTNGATANAEAPLAYTHLDDMAIPYVAYTYWLQEVEVTGIVNEYGPVTGIVRRSSTARDIFLPMVTNR